MAAGMKVVEEEEEEEDTKSCLPTVRDIFPQSPLLKRHYIEWWVEVCDIAHGVPEGRNYTYNKVSK